MIYRFLLVIPLCILLCGCSRYDYDEITLDDAHIYDGISIDAVSQDEKPADKIYVYVCGEVVSAGVYEVSEGTRIYEALELAGGATAEAELKYINQAELCYDGEKIYVPSVDEYDIVYDGQPELKVGDSRININTADSETLQQIKGIGASRAEDIISYRESCGRFSSIEDIMNVPGIKQGMFDRIKDQIKV